MFEKKKKDTIQWPSNLVSREVDQHLRDAATSGDIAAVQKQLAAGASVSAKDTVFGRTALGWTSCCQVATLLLDAAANVNARDFVGYTPLHISTMKGNVELAKLLAQRGAVLSGVDISGYTALDWCNHYAPKNVVKELSALLINKHMQMFVPKKQDPIPWIPCRVPRDIDAKLHDAAIRGDGATVTLLLNSGADANATDTIFGRSVIGWTRDTNVAQLLLGARASVNAREYGGKTPLHLAVIRGSADLVNLFLENGADLSFKDISGFTAAQWATEATLPEIEGILSSFGSFPEQPKNSGKHQNSTKQQQQPRKGKPETKTEKKN